MKRPSPSTPPREEAPFVERAIEKLRREGLRITMPRLQVLRALASSDRPANAYTIHAEIHAAGGRIDVVSVYRILNLLHENGLVHRLGAADGYLACGVPHSHEEHTEHLFCRSCGRAFELEVDARELEPTLRHVSERGFVPTQVRIEVVGVCAECSHSGESDPGAPSR